MADATVRIDGLTKLDKMQIGTVPGVSFEESTIPDGSHGEVTVLAAVFTLQALATLAAFVLRKQNNESFSETVEIQHADGRKEKRVIKWTKDSAEAPDASIIRQIQNYTPS